MTRASLVLGAILLVFALLAATYSFVTPPWEAPDEPSHYLYAEYLALHGNLPPPTPAQQGRFWEYGYVTSLYEWYQPPLYYTLLAPQLAVVNVIRPGALPQDFPAVNPDFPHDAVNVFVPEDLASPFAKPALRVARLFSVVLGLFSLLATYRLALLVTSGDQAIALTATGLMAFIPQFTFLSGYVSNDNLVVLMATLCLLACVSLLDYAQRPKMKWAVGAGLVTSLALLTKLSLLYVLPLGLCCLLWRWVQHRSVRLLMLESAVFGGLALAPLTLGLVLSPAMQEQWTHAAASLTPRPDQMNLEYVMNLWPVTSISFWGLFGWVNVVSPKWISTTMNLITLAGLTGSLVMLVIGGKRATRSIQSALLLCWIVCVLAVFGFIRFNLAMLQPQGRLLYSALSALVLLVASGIGYLSGRYRAVVGVGLVLWTLFINLVSLLGTLLPAYA